MVLRAVLDTDVMVAGFATGASRRLLLLVLDREVRLLLSTSLLLEYEAVLTRPAVLNMAGVTVAEVLAVLDALSGLCVPVAFDYQWRPGGSGARPRNPFAGRRHSAASRRRTGRVARVTPPLPVRRHAARAAN